MGREGVGVKMRRTQATSDSPGWPGGVKSYFPGCISFPWSSLVVRHIHQHFGSRNRSSGSTAPEAGLCHGSRCAFSHIQGLVSPRPKSQSIEAASPSYISTLIHVTFVSIRIARSQDATHLSLFWGVTNKCKRAHRTPQDGRCLLQPAPSSAGPSLHEVVTHGAQRLLSSLGFCPVSSSDAMATTSSFPHHTGLLTPEESR